MKNSVELLGYYGSDETIALSAWTSTSRDLPEEKKARIPQLIKRLWNDGHETPFEKTVVHFLITTDIATHIQLLKHRIGVSVNAESARYRALIEDKTYLPNDWPTQYFSNDEYEAIANTGLGHTENLIHALKTYVDLGNALYKVALEQLTNSVGRKRAKESARFFKTYNSQIQSDVSFNMRSLAHFLKLRDSEHAQLEIREVAQEMIQIVQNLEGNPFKHTLEAWGYGVLDRQ